MIFLAPSSIEVYTRALAATLSPLVLSNRRLLSCNRMPTCVVVAQQTHLGSNRHDGQDAQRDTAHCHHASPNRTSPQISIAPPATALCSPRTAHLSGMALPFPGDTCTYHTFASIAGGPFPVFVHRENRSSQLFHTQRMRTIVYWNCPMYALHSWSRCALAFDIVPAATGWKM